MKKNKTSAYVFILFSTFILGSFSAHASIGAGKVGKFVGDDLFTSNVFDLTSRAGLTGAPAYQPWSRTFWPLRSGSSANPYADNAGIFQWLAYGADVLRGPVANEARFERRMSKIREKMNAGKLDADTINNMAPSEKYDLYLGDADFSFTHAEWQAMLEQKKFIGGITFWEGSCHGWSTAAINEPRPAHLINVMSLDGKYVIPFYPDDLKALGTRLWADSLIQDHTVLEGDRCTSSFPKQDPATGKVLNNSCQGVNPGDFHISVLELVGARKQSFVVNRSNEKNIWNQPVAGYKINYFNPITGDSGDLVNSIVARTDYADPYARFRAPQSRFIVGVEMELKYVSETVPSHKKEDSAKDDLIKTMDVRYDLELDENNQIVGGEWRNDTDPVVADDGTITNSSSMYSDETPSIPKYPGFLWKFEDAHPTAYSIADQDFAGDDVSKIDPGVLLAASKKASQFRYNIYKYDSAGNATLKRQELEPQPLGKVVNALFRQASN